MNRNTPEAPQLPHCENCGATEMDKSETTTPRGKITMVRGRLQCEPCRTGAEELVRDEPDKWAFDENGQLQSIDPAWLAAKTAREQGIAALRALMSAMVADLDRVSVEEGPPEWAGAALVLGNGYRFHILMPDPDGITNVHLFRPDRTHLMKEPLELTNPLDVRPAIIAAITEGSELHILIEHDVTENTEIALFDPDVLLAGTDEGGITPEAAADGHRYVMGEVNAYCPRCSEIATEREGRPITVLDCDFDTSK